MTRSALNCSKCNQSVEYRCKDINSLRVFSTVLHFLHLFLKNYYKQKNMTETLYKKSFIYYLTYGLPYIRYI